MKDENPKILDDFLKYLLNIKSYSIQTINSYNIDLLLFFYFIKEYQKLKIQVKDFNKFVLLQVKGGDIIAFLVHCNYNRKNNAYTRQRKLMSIKCFFKWLYENIPNDSILHNPTEEIKSVIKIERLPKYLSLENAKRMVDVFNKSNSNNPIRDNMIIYLFLSTGLRVSELISVKIKDINFNNKTIRVLGKGNKERTVYFNEKCKNKLLNYLNKLYNNNINVDNYLFLTYRKQKYTRNGIYYICQKAYKLLNLEDKHYSTHTLRHTSATLLYMYVKQDILLIKKFLGHESISSSQIYTHLHNEKLKEAVDNNPLNNFIINDLEKSA